MTVRAMAAAAVLMLVGCSRGSDGPPTQQAYVREWQALLSTWRAQDGNDIRQGQAEDRARAFFQQPRAIEGWTAKVVGVKSALGSTWVEADQSGVTFHLRPPDGGEDRARPAFAQLMPGDRIHFNGTIKSELSVTMAGALRHPVLSVTLMWIQKPK